jgi:hypothetical protein
LVETLMMLCVRYCVLLLVVGDPQQVGCFLAACAENSGNISSVTAVLMY